MRKKSLYLKLFWSVFSRIRTEYGEIQNNSEYGHFLTSAIWGQSSMTLFFTNIPNPLNASIALI